MYMYMCVYIYIYLEYAYMYVHTKVYNVHTYICLACPHHSIQEPPLAWSACGSVAPRRSATLPAAADDAPRCIISHRKRDHDI